MERDTDLEARRRYHEILRAAAPEKRLEAAVSLGVAVRTLALAGMRERYPNADDAELRVRLAVRLYGRLAASKLFRDIPEDAV